MIVGLLAIISAILLSVVSAYFSITGITTIFSGAALAVGVMGGVFELAKVSATIWLYNFWKAANLAMKWYFFISIFVLICISSIGIYGFLVSGYVGQEVDTRRFQNQIEQTQARIDRENQKISQAQDQLDILDESIERYLELNIVTRGLAQREEQSAERQRLREEISQSRDVISEHEDRIFELREDLNNQQVDVGPVKYIASFIYGEEQAQEYYDNSVRWLSLLFVIVFDPFAVLLMVAGNIAFRQRGKKSSKRKRPKGPKVNDRGETPQHRESSSTEEEIPTGNNTFDIAEDDYKHSDITYVEANQETPPGYDKQVSPPPRMHRKKKKKR